MLVLHILEFFYLYYRLYNYLDSTDRGRFSPGHCLAITTDHVYPPNSKVLNVDSTKNTIKPTYDASNDVNLKTSARTNPVASRTGVRRHLGSSAKLVELLVC